MDSTITRNVNDIAAEERRALESLLGEELASDQQVFIAAYTPGIPPNDTARNLAASRLKQTIANNHALAVEQQVSPAEADAAVAEAVEAIRRRG
jgi:hypothetical protein